MDRKLSEEVMDQVRKIYTKPGWNRPLQPGSILAGQDNDGTVVLVRDENGYSSRVVLATCRQEWLASVTLLKLGQFIWQEFEEIAQVEDLDAVVFRVEVGNSFHGVPDGDRLVATAASELQVTDSDEEIEWGWVSVQCTDYAS